MDVGRHLISKILLEKDIKPVLDSKITEDFFEDDEHAEVFTWIREFWGKYGEVPSSKSLKRNFPTYKLIKANEPYSFYIDELRVKRKYGLVHDTLVEAAQALEAKDPDAAVGRLSSGITQVGTEVSVMRDTDLTETWESRMDHYRALKNSPGMLGLPTGFPTIDQATAGLQPEQLVTFIGENKSGKSTFMMRMALEAHRHGAVPLFVGFEMSNEEQSARHDAMRAGIDHHALITGQMTSKDEKKLRRALRDTQNMPPFLLSSDIGATSTISGLAAKIEEYQPAVVFLDGVYLMDDEVSQAQGVPKGSPQALTNLTRGLKRLAQTTKIPIVGSTQVLSWKVTRSKGLTADAIGYTSSFGQDSDVILGVENTDHQDTKKLRIVIARNCPPKEVTVRWDWGVGEFEELGDVFGDDEDEDDE